MILEILKYPHPVLKAKAEKVEALNEGVIRLIDDLVETLYASPGVGLAAPQVGYPLRVIAVDVLRNGENSSRRKNSGHGLMVLLNPVILYQEGEKVVREGCLSLPEYTANVKRARRVVVSGLDRSGEPVEVAAKDFEAVALQHEIDHLEGILFIERVNCLKTDLFRRKEG
ncbi:MAG: peptide deformylase [Candidatus Tectomicrobia bacterium]|uniref:Peptide deformylase n=1 Tax=Tectimicrobiota bacterium TaxID=2528274 RepID=A0A932CLD5_UNCTE|nr:peptide deformylase [Candidatus Tectomicrobia bacterium]